MRSIKDRDDRRRYAKRLCGSGAALETPAARQIVPKIAEALRVCRDVGIKII